MIFALYLTSIMLLGLGIIIVRFSLKQNKSFGILSGKRIYQDTEKNPGEKLYANSLPLVGKPDFIIIEDGNIVPVEVKTGKTPQTPYLNHRMQLIAYCLLVEENFHKRPLGGYIRYPHNEFKLAYTKEAEESVRNLVHEMVRNKKTNSELHCSHLQHNR